MKKMRIVITGTTGLLGRNLLFEIIKQNIDNLQDLEIISLGRPKKSTPIDERLDNIILNDGSYYIGFDPKKSEDLLFQIRESLISIPFDLSIDNLGISEDGFKILKERPIDYFFHVAALTDFRSGKAIEEKLDEINIKGTQRVCNLLGNLKVKEAIYIGSAYSCGDKTGLVYPDHINLNSNFRNPYEKSKLAAEILFRKFVKSNKLNYKVFRPSTICGRLIEKPLGQTCKYDVFYSWTAFFLRQKIKHLKSIEKIYEIPVEMPIRLHFNPKGGLNIVPVDYGAKVIYGACISNEPYHDYHISNSAETPNRLYGDSTFKVLNISGYEYVISEPNNKNEIESLYYRTVGRLFTPYGLSDPSIFDISNLKEFHKKNQIICPLVDEKNFNILLNYAKKDYFGIDIEKLKNNILKL